MAWRGSSSVRLGHRCVLCWTQQPAVVNPLLRRTPSLRHYRSLLTASLSCANGNPPALTRTLIGQQLSIRSSRDFSDDSSKQTSDGKRPESKDEDSNKRWEFDGDDKPPASLWAKFKWYLRRYWYVVIPVHALTTVACGVGCYAIAYCGVRTENVAAVMERLYMPDGLVRAVAAIPPSAGHIATALILYKLISPLHTLSTVVLTAGIVRLMHRLGTLPTSRQVGSMAKQQHREARQALKDRRQSWKDRSS